MPINKITKALATSVDRFAVYHPKTISDEEQTDKTFFVLGERIEIIHERRHSTQLTDLKSLSDFSDTPERRSGPRKRADSSPETISSPAIQARGVRKKDFKIDRSEDTIMSSESGSLRLNGSSSDYESSSSAIHLAKRFERADWNIFQKRVFYQSFAQKPHDFLVFLSKEAAIKEMDKYTVSPQHKEETVRIGTPMFKVIASESEVRGQRSYTIHHIAKIYFHNQSCRVYADMGQINTADKHHTEVHDFLFTAENIKDNIPPPVKISQDLKIPLILLALTFATQVIQILVTHYLPSKDDTSC